MEGVSERAVNSAETMIITAHPEKSGWLRPWPGLLSGLMLLATFISLKVQGQPLPAASEAEQTAGYTRAHIEMRDGIQLTASIHLPAGQGPFPTLYASSPYPDQRIVSGGQDELIQWYLAQGYAMVIVSSRGTGHSEGSYGFLSRNEQQDHYETIAWIASQAWSDRRVAGFGSGYSATAQWQMAIQNPSQLACIAPHMGVLDPYSDWVFPGGVASDSFLDQWYEPQLRSAHAYPAGSGPESAPARLLDLDMRYIQLEHPHYDAFWAERSSASRLDEIRVPVYVLRSWDAEAPGTRSSLKALDSLRSQHRTLLLNDDGGSGYSDFASPDFHARELLPFYDWCLKGQNNGFIVERPEIRYQVAGRTLEKRDSRWPPGGTRVEPLYLHPGDMSLSFSPPGSQQEGTNGIVYGDGTGQQEIEFRTTPLEQDLEINGSLMLEFHLRSTAADTAFEVSLLDQGYLSQHRFEPDNLPGFLNPSDNVAANNTVLTPDTPTLISKGWLKASARTTDESEGSEYEPHYRLDVVSPLTPGNIHRIRLAMNPVAHRFPQGHELVVRIRQVSDPALQRYQPTDELLSSGTRPSRLWLPVVQSGTRSRTLPQADELNATATPLPSFSSLPQEREGEIDYEGALFDSDSLFIPLPPRNAPASTTRQSSDSPQ